MNFLFNRSLLLTLLALNLCPLLNAQDEIIWKSVKTLEYASYAHKPIMVYVRRVGDGFCERMENTTLSDQHIVQNINENFTVILMELSEPQTFKFNEGSYNNAIDFMKRNGVESPSIPSILFFDHTGKGSGILKGMKSIEELNIGLEEAKNSNHELIIEKLEEHEIEYIQKAEKIVKSASFCTNQTAIFNDAFGDLEQLKGEYQGGSFGSSGHYRTRIQFDEVPWAGTVGEDADFIRLTYLLIKADIGKYKDLEGTMERLLKGIQGCPLPSKGQWTGDPRDKKITFKHNENGRSLTLSLIETKDEYGSTKINLEYFIQYN